MGDINIDYSDDSNRDTKKLLSFISSYTLRQVIKSPTRYSLNKNSLLDVMITDLKFVKLAEPCNVNLNDHLPTLLIYKKVRERNKTVQVTCRSKSNLNVDRFKDLLERHDWSKIYNLSDPNSMWEYFYEEARVILDETCPNKTLTVKRDKLAYITNTIIDMGHERDRLFKVAANIKTENS